MEIVSAFTMIRIFLLGALLLLISSVQSEDKFASLAVTGDSQEQRLVLPGDFYLFRCDGDLNGSSPADVAWFFKLTNGNYIPVNKFDIGESHEYNSFPHLFLRESFIRINSPDVKTITCDHKTQSQFFHGLKVTLLVTILLQIKVIFIVCNLQLTLLQMNVFYFPDIILPDLINYMM